jgi:hypothetical protein
MKIEWNKVTWYSKLAAVILFTATLYWGFCLGVHYEQARAELRETSNFGMPQESLRCDHLGYCEQGQ